MSGGIFSHPGSKMARPLAYAPQGYALPGLRGLRSMRGLGSAGLGASNLPGNCWEVAGFKDCHAKAFAEAQRDCGAGLAKDAYGGDMATCIERNADAYAWAGCVNKYCKPSAVPRVTGPTPITWKNANPNPLVTKLQQALNPRLVSNGANPITVDGKLGPGTCGAAYWVDGVDGSSFYVDYGLANVCNAMTMPTKKGTTTPVQTIAVAPRTTITKDEVFTEKSGLPWDVFDADTTEVQKRLNIQLDAADMNPLNTAGVLNAPTCGAMKWAKETQGIDLLSIQGINCQGFTAPTKRIKANVPTTTTPSPTGPVLPTDPNATKFSAASMATTGLIVGVLGVGTYYLGKKYNWF